MTDYISKRLRYFNQQFLTEPDFTDEQTYHMARRHGHNRVFIRRGIAEGLEVVVDAPNAVVEVHSGIAFDVEGRQIVLAQTRVLDLAEVTSPGEAYVIIEYDEVATDKQLTSLEDFTRWDEQPIVGFSQPGPGIDPSPDQILLARLTVDTNGQVSAHDPSVRTYAGVDNLGDGAVTDPKLADDAISSAKIAEADGTSGQDTDTGAGIKTDHLQDSSVVEPKLAINAVSSAKIAEADGTSDQDTDTGSGIKTGHLQDGAVTDPKLAINAVSSAKIAEADGTSGQDTDTGAGIKTDHLQDSSVIEPKLAINAVSSAKIAEADGTSGQVTGTGAGIKTGHIQDNAVTTAKLGEKSVRRSNIAMKLIKNDFVFDLGPGASVTELVEEGAQASKILYLPTAVPFETTGTGNAQVEPSIVYRQVPGAAFEKPVDVYVRFVNHGSAKTDFWWFVYTFAE